MPYITLTETAKMIRETLKVAFPRTKFSVRSKSYSGGCSITAHWTDGPTSKQMAAILNRFEGKGFDGMTDCSYYCGKRTYKGQPIEFCGAYIFGSRTISDAVQQKVADTIRYECGVSADFNGSVPFAWHSFWNRDAEGNEKPLTFAEIESGEFILAHDSHKSEYISRLIDEVTYSVSLEAQQPVELPEYIDKDATVSTGRASFEQPMKMFEGHEGVA